MPDNTLQEILINGAYTDLIMLLAVLIVIDGTVICWLLYKEITRC